MSTVLLSAAAAVGLAWPQHNYSLRPLANGEARRISVVRYSELKEGDPIKQALGEFGAKFKSEALWGRCYNEEQYLQAAEKENVRRAELADPARREGKSERIILLEGDRVIGLLVFIYEGQGEVRYSVVDVARGLRRQGYGALLWEILLDVIDADMGTSSDRTLYFGRRLGQCHYWNKILPRMKKRGGKIDFDRSRPTGDLKVVCRAGSRFGIGQLAQYARLAGQTNRAAPDRRLAEALARAI